MPDRRYWLGLSCVHGIGPTTFRRLLDTLGSPEAAWRASPGALETAGLDKARIRGLEQTRLRLDLDAELARLARHGVDILTWNDTNYPRRLREIHDAPPVLYVRGQLLPVDEWSIAVVGTRRATSYGRQVTQELTAALAANGITVVSGLAKGIDACAHRAALESGGRTIGVLACGLDLLYPADHLALAREMAQTGALVSELPLGTRPVPGAFPARNRLISGLSLGVLVVEGDVGSGARITANFALDQNREVFAVPGSVFSPASRLTNGLIRDGQAKLVARVEDILEELNLSMVTQQLEMKELLLGDETEAAIYRHLSHEPTHIDDLGRLSGLPASSVSSTLTIMELKGLVRHQGGMRYVRARELSGQYGTSDDEGAAGSAPSLTADPALALTGAGRTGS